MKYTHVSTLKTPPVVSLRPCLASQTGSVLVDIEQGPKALSGSSSTSQAFLSASSADGSPAVPVSPEKTPEQGVDNVEKAASHSAGHGSSQQRQVELRWC